MGFFIVVGVCSFYFIFLFIIFLVRGGEYFYKVIFFMLVFLVKVFVKNSRNVIYISILFY